ncbi:hypothetical protein B0H15DRAFT_863356 [Mycena belliarum]|uniref:Uncharacterized protein n=1 Tax=Mycena belliarum TaxID=1033014 RepID=A0AAD6TR58_9AGAR|nr:hypothetical protein B0H15DRAFT_863356 [Mycena belliae]
MSAEGTCLVRAARPPSVSCSPSDTEVERPRPTFAVADSGQRATAPLRRLPQRARKHRGHQREPERRSSRRPSALSPAQTPLPPQASSPSPSQAPLRPHIRRFRTRTSSSSSSESLAATHPHSTRAPGSASTIHDGTAHTAARNTGLHVDNTGLHVDNARPPTPHAPHRAQYPRRVRGRLRARRRTR